MKSIIKTRSKSKKDGDVLLDGTVLNDIVRSSKKRKLTYKVMDDEDYDNHDDDDDNNNNEEDDEDNDDDDNHEECFNEEQNCIEYHFDDNDIIMPCLVNNNNHVNNNKLTLENLNTKAKLLQMSVVINDDLLEKKILEMNMHMAGKSIIYNAYNRWKNNNDSKLKDWIDYAMRIPLRTKMVNSTSRPYECIRNVKKSLDENLYGMIKEKEELLMMVNNMINNPKCSNLNLGFVGEPGIGKTELIRSLAKSLDIPFVQISLGGCKDASFLEGHTFTWEGSEPGIIAKSLCQVGYKNPIIYFDEIDKISESGKEVISSLLHILDPTQNMEFRDKYFGELTIDLSHVWFMFSMNDETKINSILLDRMHIMRATPPSFDDKCSILKNFILPRVFVDVGIESSMIHIQEDAIKCMVRRREKESGVRGLKMDALSIIRKLSMIKNLKSESGNECNLSFDTKNITFPCMLTPNIIENLIQKITANENVFYEMYM